MPQGNPYAQFGRSQRLSQFVDQSIPAELMLRSIAAKQERQDKAQALVDQTGLWDLENIGAGDEELVNETKEEIKKFVEEYSSKDKTTSQAQREIKNFVTQLTTDTKLKQVTKNQAKVAAMEKQIAALKLAGHQEFSPSVKRAQRIIQEYKDSGKKGEAFDSIDIEKALNLEAKEASLFDQMPAEQKMWFSDAVRNMPEGYTATQGWKGITDKRVTDRAKELAKDYKQTPEGQQALALYRELVLDYKKAKAAGQSTDGVGINPDQVSADDYLTSRLIKAGREFVGRQNTLSMQRTTPVSKDQGNNKKKKVPEVIVNQGQNIPFTAMNSMEDLNKQILDETDPTRKNQLIAIRDRRLNFANNTLNVQALDAANQKLIKDNTGNKEESIPVPKANDFARAAFFEADGTTSKILNADPYDIRKPGSKGVTDEMKQNVAANLPTQMAPIFAALSEFMPQLIEEQILDKHNIHFANNMKHGSTFHADYDIDSNGQLVHGITVSGVNPRLVKGEFGGTHMQPEHSIKGQFYSFKDMGVARKDLAFLDKFVRQPGAEGYRDGSKSKGIYQSDGHTSPFGRNERLHDVEQGGKWDRSINPYVSFIDSYEGLMYDKAMDAAGAIYSTDNDYSDDATDKIYSNLKDVGSNIEKQEGRSVITGKTVEGATATLSNAVDHVLSQIDADNFEVILAGGEGTRHPRSNEILQYIQNLAPGKVTTRAFLNDRGLSVTIGQGGIPWHISGKERGSQNMATVIIKEKKIGNFRDRSGTFDNLYDQLDANAENLSGKTGMESVLRSNINNQHQSLRELGINSGYADGLPAMPSGYDYTARLNPNDVNQPIGNKGADQRVQNVNPYYLGINGTNVSNEQIITAAETIEKHHPGSKENAALFKDYTKRKWIEAAFDYGFSREDALTAFNYREEKKKHVGETFWVGRDDEKQRLLEEVLSRAIYKPTLAANWNDFRTLINMLELSNQLDPLY